MEGFGTEASGGKEVEPDQVILNKVLHQQLSIEDNKFVKPCLNLIASLYNFIYFVFPSF